MSQETPFFFGPAQRPLFGWLHQPDPESVSDVGILICNPLGYEAISSHRTLRHLAGAAAGCGFPALRFDYDGTGDSAGQEIDPARMAAWLASIRIAAATLCEQTGVQRIGVVGIRMGASLALLAAQHMPQVVATILVDPVVEGRRYLRELRALAATSATTTTQEPLPDQDIQEAAGFITTAETRHAINSIRLAGDELQAAPPRVLLLERPDLPANDALPDRLHQLGCIVTRSSVCGYADMMRDAHESVVPHDMIGEALAWLRESVGSCIVPRRAQLPGACELEWTTEDQSAHLRERAVRFGTEGNIFGIVTDALPPPGGIARTAPVLLLLNSGAVHHVGPNRLYVLMARQIALHGFKVLRLDLPGLGDSPAARGEEENQTYPESAIAYVKQAVEYANRRLGATEVHSAGICSGAYHSLKAAVAGVPLRSSVVINPLTFFWKPWMSLAQPEFRDTAEVMRYRRTGLSVASVRKLLKGNVDLANLTGILWRYSLRRARNAMRHVGRILGMNMRDDLVAELRKVRAQGTQMHFVFATTDPGHALLREQAGAAVQRLAKQGALSIDFIDRADHTFTPRVAQERLVSRVTQIVTM